MSAEAPLAKWQQGDVCVDVPSIPFLSTFETVGEFPTRGAVVVTQTCDVIREIEGKPYVQLAALIEVDADLLEDISKFNRPRFAIVPALKEKSLVADLDVTITIEKSALVDVQPVRGCPEIADQQNFAYALGRHRNRFAFPDECSVGLRKLRNWVKSKGKVAGPNGAFLRAIEQFRIWADDLSSPTQVEILCVLDDDPGPDVRATWVAEVIPRISDLVKDWCANCAVHLQTTEELNLAEYRRFTRMDFDALTLQPDPEIAE